LIYIGYTYTKRTSEATKKRNDHRRICKRRKKGMKEMEIEIEKNRNRIKKRS